MINRSRFSIAWFITISVSLCCTLHVYCSKSANLKNDVSKREQIEAMYEGYRSDFPEVPAITVAELDALMKNNDIVLVDVRDSREQAVSMIPGAISVDTFEKRPDVYRDNKVVTYCTIGYRSGLYTRKLRESGFDAYNLRGSILLWLHAGNPVVDDAGAPVGKVHVYGQEWDLAPDEIEAVW